MKYAQRVTIRKNFRTKKKPAETINSLDNLMSQRYATSKKFDEKHSNM